jgi:hypothetical protein
MRIYLVLERDKSSVVISPTRPMVLDAEIILVGVSRVEIPAGMLLEGPPLSADKLVDLFEASLNQDPRASQYTVEEEKKPELRLIK